MTKIIVKTGSISYRINGVKYIAQVGDVLDLPSELIAKIDPRFIAVMSDPVVLQTTPEPDETGVYPAEELPVIQSAPKKRVRKLVSE